MKMSETGPELRIYPRAFVFFALRTNSAAEAAVPAHTRNQTAAPAQTIRSFSFLICRNK
jgi:hypothetical protein